MVSNLYRSLGIPIVFDLDVNAAAFGEYYWNPENRTRNPLVYFTIGTGIGGGIVVDGRLVHGLLHPEAGHVLIPHDWQRDPYPGGCPYHGDCFEGLASGPAMQQRWGQPAETLPADHPAWDLEATYIALAMSNVIYTLSPKRIVLGGGVMQHEGLFPMVWDRVRQYLNGYIRSPGILERIDDTIVHPSLGHRSGILGAIALARLAVEGK
jgi:fructokinase